MPIVTAGAPDAGPAATPPTFATTKAGGKAKRSPKRPPRGTDEASKFISPEHEAEYRAFIASHPDIEAVEFLLVDPNGVMRGKWAPGDSLKKAFQEGVNFPMSLHGLDVWGREVVETGLHIETGDKDGYCRATRGSLSMVPWAKRKTAQVLLQTFTPEGEPIPADATDRFEIRFHLHPTVKASRRTDGSSVLLVLPGKENWLFSAPNMDVEVEESVFLSATDGPRRSSQIVIADEVRALPRVVWTFIRATQPQREKEREQADAAGPKLPL